MFYIPWALHCQVLHSEFSIIHFQFYLYEYQSLGNVRVQTIRSKHQYVEELELLNRL